MNKHTRRRLKENEVIFREANQEVVDFVEGDTGAAGVRLAFYCECSMPDCRERIELATSKYKELHQNERRFIALAGHETPKIEKVVQRLDGFNVLEKFGKIPSPDSIDLALSNATL